MKISNPLGGEGEEIAAKYLQKLGFKIIDRNFRARNTEIDIVAVYDNTLIFVEVKREVQINSECLLSKLLISN